jgi:hypothetical protein
MQIPLVALSIAAIFLGVVVLCLCIARIFRLLRESEVARVPAAAEATVTLSAPGTYVLHVDQPRFNMAMLGAKFELLDEATGADVRSSPIIFRTTVSGLSTASVSVRYFEIEHAGAYRLLVTGIDSRTDLSQVHLILTRPYAVPLMLLILATVLGGMFLIGGLVFTALLYSGKL